jgi:hypothetical protein
MSSPRHTRRRPKPSPPGSEIIKIDAGSGTSKLAETITASGAINFADKTADITVQQPGVGAEEVRIVAGAGYVKLPAAAERLVGKPWAHAATTTSTSKSSAGASDPGQTLGFLKTVSDGVTKTGQSTVRGTASTDYRVTLNLKKLAATQTNPAIIQRLETLLGKSTLDLTVSVDGQHRVDRIVETVPLPVGAASSSGGSEVVTEEFYDFGTPVHVVAPPAGDVGQLPTTGSASGSSPSPRATA